MISRHYLRSRTRNPAFLWRMVGGILLAGVLAGLAVDWLVPAWIRLDAPSALEPAPLPAPNPEPQAPEYDLDALADAGDWRGVWWGIPHNMFRGWRQLGPTALAVLTGACWLLFALQAIQVRGPRDYRLWALLAALALGVLSIWPTVFLIYWQERAWNLSDSQQLSTGLRHFILGVGLREELAKFACFLPLLPWLVLRRDELATLMIGGCVGLGFAMEENINYIAGSAGTSTLARLLSPAPLHMAMTGLIALAAYRACVWPRECGPQFIAVFGVVVLAHGLFDAFIALPVLQEYALASSVIFLMLIYQFFRELRSKRKPTSEAISLSANFLCCVSIVAAATFVYVCAAAGWQVAADALAAGVMGQAVMAYLFLREMPETMVTV